MRKYKDANEFNKANYSNIQFRVDKNLLPEYTEIAKAKGYKSVHSYAKAIFNDAIKNSK